MHCYGVASRLKVLAGNLFGNHPGLVQSAQGVKACSGEIGGTGFLTVITLKIA